MKPQKTFQGERVIIETAQGNKVSIDTIHQFFFYQNSHPQELSGLVLETLIRELILTASNPVNFKIQQLEANAKSYQQELVLFSQRINEYDKRLHQVIEFVKSKHDDLTFVTPRDLEILREDLQAMHFQVENKVLKTQEQLFIVEARQNSNDTVVEMYKTESNRQIEQLQKKVQDYVAEQVTDIQNSLAKDYELHYTKYHQLLLKVMEIQNDQEQKSKSIQQHHSMIGGAIKQLSQLSQEKDERDHFLDEYQRKEEKSKALIQDQLAYWAHAIKQEINQGIFKNLNESLTSKASEIERSVSLKVDHIVEQAIKDTLSARNTYIMNSTQTENPIMVDQQVETIPEQILSDQKPKVSKRNSGINKTVDRKLSQKQFLVEQKEVNLTEEEKQKVQIKKVSAKPNSLEDDTKNYKQSQDEQQVCEVVDEDSQESRKIRDEKNSEFINQTPLKELSVSDKSFSLEQQSSSQNEYQNINTQPHTTTKFPDQYKINLPDQEISIEAEQNVVDLFRRLTFVVKQWKPYVRGENQSENSFVLDKSEGRIMEGDMFSNLIQYYLNQLPKVEPPVSLQTIKAIIDESINQKLEALYESMQQMIQSSVSQRMAEVDQMRDELKFYQKNMIKAKNHVDSLADKMQQSEGKNLTEIKLIKDSFSNLIQVLRISFAFEQSMPQDLKERYSIQRFQYIDKIKQLLFKEVIENEQANQTGKTINTEQYSPDTKNQAYQTIRSMPCEETNESEMTTPRITSQMTYPSSALLNKQSQPSLSVKVADALKYKISEAKKISRKSAMLSRGIESAANITKEQPLDCQLSNDQLNSPLTSRMKKNILTAVNVARSINSKNS